MKKGNAKSVVPTESELEILQILWRKGPLPVRAVNTILNEVREVGYTTTLKIMQIMTDKGLVNRDTSARTHIYAAHPKKETTTGHLLQKFLKTAYNGSVSKLVMQALGNHETSADELAEIKQLIKDIEKSNDV